MSCHAFILRVEQSKMAEHEGEGTMVLLNISYHIQSAFCNVTEDVNISKVKHRSTFCFLWN
jgi:hypothetical protein